MDDNEDFDPSLKDFSPSRNPGYFASSGYLSSLPSSLQEWILSVEIDDGNASSSTLSLVRSPSPPQGWPCEKTFHPEREGEMEGDFNEMPRGGSMDYDNNSLILFSPSPKAPSPEASWRCTFSPSNNFCIGVEDFRITVKLLIQLMKLRNLFSYQLVGETHDLNGENVLSEGGIHSAYPKNESTRKTSNKMCRNIKNSITLEDLQQFNGSRMDAAKNFGVSVPTLKRRCRQLGITDWRHLKKRKKYQYLSKPKDIIESVHGDRAKMGAQMAGECRSYERELDHEQNVFPPEFVKGTQMEITTAGDLFVSSTHERCIEAGHPLELPAQPSELNPFAACLRAPEGKLLMDDNISATEAFNSEQIPESNWKSLSFSDPAPKQDKATAAVKMPLVTKTQHTETVTMKAKYGEKMIKFRLSLTSGINELKKEVAKRLMLEVSTFSIEYRDNDNDWILIACDEDLKDCFLLGCNDISLLIQNIRPISGAPDKAMGNRREIGL